MMKKNLLLLLCGLFMVAKGYPQWNVSGNSISTGNFFGTTNAQSLLFKVNNSNGGQVDVSYQNLFFGLYTGGTVSATAVQNVALGYNALTNNSSGQGNVASGRYGLASNTTGSYNIALGTDAMYANTTGAQNNAVGALALYYNSNGNNNNAFGFQSLLTNSSGSNSNAFGSNAMYSNSTGGSNLAMGDGSLYTATTSTENTAVGCQASQAVTTGSSNTTIGMLSMFNNDVGLENVVVGYGGLGGIIPGNGGYYNTSIGSGSLDNITGGIEETAAGFYSIFYTENGHINMGYGAYSLYTNTDGGGNAALGYDADVNYQLYDYTTVIGNQAVGTASNTIVFGNGSVTSIGGYANWSNISDGRYKKNIQENVPGLELITQLRPVTYNLDVTGINKLLQPAHPKTKDGRTSPSSDDAAAIKQKEAMLHTGFIAQEVETTAKKLNYPFSAVDAPKTDKGLYALRYDDFVGPLVKSVQTLSHTNDSLRTVLNNLQTVLNSLQQQVNSLTSATHPGTN